MNVDIDVLFIVHKYPDWPTYYYYSITFTVTMTMTMTIETTWLDLSYCIPCNSSGLYPPLLYHQNASVPIIHKRTLLTSYACISFHISLLCFPPLLSHQTDHPLYWHPLSCPDRINWCIYHGACYCFISKAHFGYLKDYQPSAPIPCHVWLLPTVLPSGLPVYILHWYHTH